MKKTNLEKGITLIALIITIVVLLILAVVTINSIQGDGIILKAKQAADNYTAMANDEQTKLNTLLSQIEENTGNGGTTEQVKIATFVQSGTTITGKDADGNVIEGFSMNVGDTIAYNCYDKEAEEAGKLTYTATTTDTGNYTSYFDTSYHITVPDFIDDSAKLYTITSENSGNITWKVLGVNDGKILITTQDVITPELILGGNNGYRNANTILANICAIFGNGKFAETARSFNKTDIINIIGEDYTPDVSKEVAGWGYTFNKSYNGMNDNLGLIGSAFIAEGGFSSDHDSGFIVLCYADFSSSSVGR